MEKGKVVIFGANGGIGSATAHRLRAKNYQLHLVGRKIEPLEKMAFELSASYTLGDVLDEDLF